MNQYKILHSIIYSALMLGCLLSQPTRAQDAALMAPINIDNLQPFHALFSAPTQFSSAITAAGTKRLDIDFDLVSNFTDAVEQDESIVIDGETYRLALTGRYGIKDDWELGFKLPIISHRGGFLDNFLIHWHNWFGLPSLGRDSVANNQLNYVYRDASGIRVNITNNTSGLGDIALFAGRRLKTSNAAVERTLFTSLKLPTGSARKLTGSGAADLSLWINQSYQRSDKFRFDFRAGISALGHGKVLTEKQRDWLGFATTAFSYRLRPRVSLKTSLQLNSSPYQNSQINQLTDNVVQLSLGGSIRINKNWLLDIAVVEDEFNPDASPDVSFKLALRNSVNR